MGRPKKPTVKLHTLSDCTLAIAELLDAQTELESVRAERDLAVAAASAAFEQRLDAARMRTDDLEAGLKAYYYGHVTELEEDGRKYVQLATGRMGRRDNPPSLKPVDRNWGWPAIKAAVRARFGLKYFHEVKEPELDKEALKDALLAVEELRQLGLKVESGETFYVEPARLPDPVEVQR